MTRQIYSQFPVLNNNRQTRECKAAESELNSLSGYTNKQEEILTYPGDDVSNAILDNVRVIIDT
jgi:hypothetical protein